MQLYNYAILQLGIYAIFAIIHLRNYAILKLHLRNSAILRSTY